MAALRPRRPRRSRADAAAAELTEEGGALDEERALLGEEGLEGREVHDGRIHLDLAEVRIHRGVQREVGPETELRVHAAAGREIPPLLVDGEPREMPAEGDLAQLEPFGQGFPPPLRVFPDP